MKLKVLDLLTFALAYRNPFCLLACIEKELSVTFSFYPLFAAALVSDPQTPNLKLDGARVYIVLLAFV